MDAIYASAVPSQPIRWAGEIGVKDYTSGAPKILWKCGHEHIEMKDASECAQRFLTKIIATFDHEGLSVTLVPDGALANG